MAIMVCTMVDNTGHSSYLSISTRFTGQLLMEGHTEGVSALLCALVPSPSTGLKHDSAALGAPQDMSVLCCPVNPGCF